jgi:hypothetical protein
MTQEDRLTWNEFQGRFKGRWSQKELASQYVEYKETGCLQQEEKAAQLPKSIHCLAQATSSSSMGTPMRAVAAQGEAEGKQPDVPRLTWNQFQVCPVEDDEQSSPSVSPGSF